MSAPDQSVPPLRPLERLWLCEAMRLREARGERLDDREANRLARAGGGDLAQRIQRRALWLATRDGQLQALHGYRHAARLALLLLALVALLSGGGLAFAALGDGSRPVNVFWALGSLLGINLLMLLLSLASFALGRDNGLPLRLWHWLSDRLARDAQQAQLAPALLLLLQRQRLARWGMALLGNGLWSLTLLAALAMLLLQLSTRRYGFVWETTLLGSDSFARLIHALGALPGLLGFAQPDSLQIQAGGDLAQGDPGARQVWAGWLLGVFVVFGLLPRLLLALGSLLAWQHGLKRLRLDLSLPAYQLLRGELQPDSEPLGIISPAPELPGLQAGGHAEGGSGALLVAIELDGQRPWPPALPAGVADAGNLDSREQRQHLLDQLSRFPPARLLIACDPRRSPDRGSLALLGELARSAAATRIWLLPAEPGASLDPERLGDWHAALQALQLPCADRAPWHWLEHGDD
ncbi:DUF2868 domain-containing protein [Pseudomonas sp. N040]|uniref:DUF2868 domain-containing protein n=1 Tax=Pseudomonas sp. N040 TaxID=2785325 RepID=UPI0018A2EFB1|nr:DUF2868 domain-containing protein [Pseudomonas sp. N040]MBF7729273.1 DUF2868 domain-containing protein [Pseudomonas sp. N040]MBW7012913.1 DUF2868 domain-containing protein [Pseudomonas sp. N040]